MNNVDITIDDIIKQIKERLVERGKDLSMNDSFMAGLEVASFVIEVYLIDLKWNLRLDGGRIIA